VSSLVRSALRAIIWATAASLIGTSLCYAGDRGAAKFTASAQDLQRYRISHSLDDLRQSIYDLQGSLFIFDLAPETFVEQRRARIRQWAEILRVIEQSYDPTYDPAVRYWQPSWPLHRPASAAENLQYQKELADFKLRTERTNDYIQLQNVDALAMTSLLMESFALAHYTKMETVSDFEALDGILVRAGISDERRLEIDAIFRDPGLNYITVSGQEVRGLTAALSTTFKYAASATLANESVEVSENRRSVDILLAPGGGDDVGFRFDKSTGLTSAIPWVQVSLVNPRAFSALDVEALISTYNKLLSGSLLVLPPWSDLLSANFSMQERNFDRSHKLPQTTYRIMYVPRSQPQGASLSRCGYFTNYRVDSETWKAVVEPLKCQTEPD